MQLTPRRRHILELVCDTLVPSRHGDSLDTRKASDLPTTPGVLSLIEGQSPSTQKEFLALLDLLGSRLLGLTWGGPLCPFDRLSAEQREQLLQRWSVSRLQLLRKGFMALKKACLFSFYSWTQEGRNPNWPDIGYRGPPRRVEVTPATSAPTVRIGDADRLSCQVLVIGSGAGGGVTAGVLAQDGLDVIVVEKGPALRSDEFNGLENSMISRLYEARGGLTTRNGEVSLLAGSCLGGGTTVNWSGCFRTPRDILEEWAETCSLPYFLKNEYQDSLDRVWRSLNAGTEATSHNRQNHLLYEASRRLGHRVAPIARNVSGCPPAPHDECGACGFGCRRSAKQGTAETDLRRAVEAGARILVDCEVERILIENGRAVGARALLRQEGAFPREIRVQADRVVVAAGGIHTPALLRRSGLTHPGIGGVLYLHPTVNVAGFYEQPIESWKGPMMSVVNDEFSRLDGPYGVKLETPPVHAGLFALAAPWSSGSGHKELMRQCSHAGHIIALTRDRHGGRVGADQRGRPVPHYRLHPYDRAHLLRGMIEAARLHWEAGARQVLLPHNRMGLYSDRDRFEAEAAALDPADWRSASFALFSAHQMGSCRMAGDVRQGPVAPDGQCYEVKNLFVADGSVLPRCSGVNPMVTIMAVADGIARNLLAGRSVEA